MREQQRQPRIRQHHQKSFPFTGSSLKEIDPIMCPATAAVEKLIPLPERECKRMRYHDAEDDGVHDENAFDLSSLARVSVSIKESLAFPLIEWSISDNESSSTSSSSSDTSIDETLSMAQSFLDNFLLTTSNNRLYRTSPSPSSSCSSLVGERRFNTNHHRRLVRSIALDSRLALLDPSARPIGRCSSSRSVSSIEIGDKVLASSVSISTNCSDSSSIHMPSFQTMSVLRHQLPQNEHDGQL